MTVTLVRGDAAHLPLPDGSVDLVVTSPPYFALRSYQDNGSHYAGQIGSEATPAEFIDALIACTREWVRVLKPAGSLWVNLGDKYAAGHGGSSTEGNGVNLTVGHQASNNFRERPDLPNPPASWGKRDASGRAVIPGTKPKSLMGLPWRYALRCIDDLGLILRAEIIWSKPNGLPESVTDRVRRSHEQWFHFTVRPRYYAAVDTIREPHNDVNRGSAAQRSARDGVSPTGKAMLSGEAVRHRTFDKEVVYRDPLGKLPGSVWSIPSQPLTVPPGLGVDHFAAFPMELPRRLIQGWSPSGICTVCGEGRRPISDKTLELTQGPAIVNRYLDRDDEFLHNWKGNKAKTGRTVATVMGECCACTPYTDHPGTGERDVGDQVKWTPEGQASRSRQVGGHLGNAPRTGPWREYHEWTPPPTRPAVVLDPFSGTGTVCLMADVLGRHGIGVDLSHDYNRLARWRTTDPGERARAMQVDKPEPVADGQMQLFDGLEAEPKRTGALGGGFAYAKAAGRTCETCPFGGQYVKGSCGKCDAA